MHERSVEGVSVCVHEDNEKQTLNSVGAPTVPSIELGRTRPFCPSCFALRFRTEHMPATTQSSSDQVRIKSPKTFHPNASAVPSSAEHVNRMQFATAQLQLWPQCIKTAFWSGEEWLATREQSHHGSNSRLASWSETGFRRYALHRMVSD